MTESSRDPDVLPDSNDLSGPCPRCGKTSTFTTYSSALSLRDGFTIQGNQFINFERAVAIVCAYCTERSLVIETRSSGTEIFRGVFWWPVPGAGVLPDYIPANVASSYDEAKRCISASAPNAAATMLRNVMTFIVADKGSDAAKNKRDLRDQLKQMANDGGPVAALAGWMDHLREFGNAGAHPLVFGDVTMDEANDIAAFAYHLIDLLYIQPAKLNARLAARGRSPAGS